VTCGTQDGLRRRAALGEDADGRRPSGGGRDMQYLILAAIVAAGIVVAVDSARQRRLRREALDVPRLAASALATPPTADVAPGGLVDETLERRGASAVGEIDGVWARLDEIVDPEAFVPKLAEGTEIKTFEMRWGNDYAIVARPDHTLHFELQPWEAELMRQMDGTRTSQELIVDHLQAAGDLDPGAVLGLIDQLRESGFLEPARPHVRSLVADHLDRASHGRRKLREFAKHLKIGWDGAERMVVACYRGGLKLFFRPWMVVLAGALAAVGFFAFVETQRSGRYVLSETHAPLETIVFLALGLFLTFAHELGHAMALIHYKRRVLSAGFFIFFGSPAFFVDASDGLMMEPRERIVQSFAGPFAELILAGIASIVVVATAGSTLAAFLYRFALINYFIIFMNLIPLLELDGYWIFSDVIQMPDLRRRSLNFVRHDLWHKLRTWQRLSLQEAGLGFYGTIGIAFTILSFYTAYFFWQQIFGGLVSSLWNGGLGSRILLVLLALAFIGPLIRGLITLGRTIYKRAKDVIGRMRFRLERSWRVEAASLIDALPAFDDLDADVLSDLAGRVELVSVRDGQTVFRQGDLADAFYVVGSGTVRIEDEDPDQGDTRILTTLHRGDAFGELGLLGAAPRAATARAEGDARLFRVDKASFDALLADDIDAPDFAPTMQSYAELRSLGPFRGLATTDLALVLDHGSWVNAAPGEAVITQGEPGDAFYVIGSGQADVVRDDEVIATLGAGAYFGEVALLTDEPRNATVIAHTPSRVFRLDREGFGDVIAHTFRRGVVDRAPDRNMEH
jgi:CRP-like cAMP-binding protein/Zn-dependent protease